MAFLRTIRSEIILIIAFSAFLSACNNVSIPTDYVSTGTLPVLYPDYANITIPENIAPLNFMLSGMEEDDCVVRVTIKQKEHLFCGIGKIQMPEDEWHEMLSEAKGCEMKVQVFVCHDGQWRAYRTFSWKVAEPIDRYVSYRLIPPSYTMYEELRLCQRDLTSFDENVFYDNKRNDRSPDHCINCHSFQNYDTKRMQFHVREAHGGTVIVDNGDVTKRNLNRSYTISAGAYPSWHPQLDLIAYSTNKTMQHFHNVDKAKVEVQDSQSDIILYDVKRDSVIVVSDQPLSLEVFPSWSPDGKYLYYSAAEVADTTKQWIIRNYKHIRYNVYRRSFRSDSLTFGEQELVYDAASDSLSALLPRISPDNKYLLCSVAPYGVFHIWHKESDLYILNLSDGEKTMKPLTAANSDCSDSYHNWSSNDRWIVFTSRRNDGNYTRLYLAYFDKNGIAHKAFEMPQQDPAYEVTNSFSYNVPELTHSPVRINKNTFTKIIHKQ